MRLNSILPKWIARRLTPERRHTEATQPHNAPEVVLTLPDGRKLTTEELRGLAGRMTVREGKLLTVTGSVSYEVVGRSSISAEAESFHQQGRQAGGRGDYKTAIRLFEQASEAAPAWPYPVYDKAYTYLLMEDLDAARICYQETLRLSPRGFFTANVALHTLNREQKGELPRGAYLRYLSLEWMEDKNQREAAVRALVEQHPQFAPAWKEFSLLCDNENERLAAIEKGLAAHPDPDTRGMLEINKALALNLLGNRNSALQLLGELALSSESTLGTEHSAKAALSILLMK